MGTSALRAELIVALRQSKPGEWTHSTVLLRRLKTNRAKETVQLSLMTMQIMGLVESRKGPGGGYRLRRNVDGYSS